MANMAWQLQFSRHRPGCSTLPDWTHLVDKVLAVIIRQLLGGPDDLVQVCVHQLVHKVHIRVQLQQPLQGFQGNFTSIQWQPGISR